MELRQLRYVDAVAKHLHFTRAAQSLGVAQPALSHQIKRLEQELGVDLFTRSRAGVRLTAAGETLLPRVRRALSELDAGREELAAVTGLRTGHVRLGAMQALGPLDLPRAIARFHDEHPGIEVTLSEESTSRMQQLVLDGDLDLAIVALDVGVPEGLAATELLTEPILLAVPHDHRLCDRQFVSVAELADERFVFFREGTGLRRAAEHIAHDAGFRPRIAFETGNLDRLLALVHEGLGVSLIPASSAARARAQIRALPLSPGLTRTAGVVWRTDRVLPPGARAMRDHLDGFLGRPESGSCPR